MAAYKLNASEVLAALQAQNVQVSAGILNQPPVSGNAAYQLNVQTLGRLTTPEQFADIILKTDAQGRPTRIRDVGHVEIGAADYGSTAFMDRSEGLLGGTYVCRHVADTGQSSMHGWGAAIDINPAFADYWLWHRVAGGYSAYVNHIPCDVVAILERHGFIWGGRWAHFDTMHFEYRPELLSSGRTK